MLTEPATELAHIGREVVKRGLTWGSSGNLSARTAGNEFLISASGARLDELTAKALVACSVEGTGHAGPVSPSVEVEMHRAVYAAVPEAAALLHTSAPYTTLVACTRMRVPVHMNTDAIAYVGRVARVAYHQPGSGELARAAAAQARRCRVLLLTNHGSLVWAESPAEALRSAEALEFLSRLLVTARAARLTLAYLTPEAAAALQASYAPSLESGPAGKRFKR